MSVTGFAKFQAEVLKLCQIKDPKLTEMGADVKVCDLLDSLAVVELIEMAEAELKVELSFEQVRGARTYWDLTEILSEKGLGC